MNSLNSMDTHTVHRKIALTYSAPESTYTSHERFNCKNNGFYNVCSELARVDIGTHLTIAIIRSDQYIRINRFLFFILWDFIYRGSLFSIFTTLIYHKVPINNNTEQDTEQDKQKIILMERFTYILTQYI